MSVLLVAIFAVPLLVCVTLLGGAAVASRRGELPTRGWAGLAGWISSAGALTALVLAVIGLLSYRAGADVSLSAVWFHVGDLEVPFSLRLDGLQAVMAVVVSAVAFLVHLYSVGYMHGDRDTSVYFAELSLFTAAMLLLVLSSNLFLLYVAWELVGASSYLLISFYFERPAAAAAGKKAFLTTRIGDLGLLIALFAIVWQTGSLDYDAVFAWAQAPGFEGAWAVAIPLLVFAGAAGKSAQFPLHVWLPDAMEGPTPVSALIHAATMVAAGVYLVARAYPLFEAAPVSLDVVAYIGAFTALMSATVAVTQSDIKKVLAYSTISQLGFMMAALGAGAPDAGIFHLLTHASFKALLFLGAGSVIHATGRQTVRDLGGLAKTMPVTAWTFAVGGLALAGIPPFAGFWSKEEVLGALLEHQPILAAALLVASFLTAVYIGRLFFLVFLGEPRLAGDARAKGHESPWVMSVPLVVLGAAAAFSGFLGAGFLGQPLQHFISIGESAGAVHSTPTWFMVLAIAVGLGGIVAAWLGYGRSAQRAGEGMGFDPRLQGAMGRAYGVVERAYLVNELYARAVVGPLVALGRFFWRGVDGRVIDGAVDGLARGIPRVGALVRRVQSGEVRDYLAAMALGAILLVVLALGGLR
ncbi:MAG: NADH-quinone oxidoreductase subunit L [Thermoleophilia bacterium]